MTPETTVEAVMHNMKYYVIGKDWIEDFFIDYEMRLLTNIDLEVLQNYFSTLIDFETAHYMKTKKIIDFMENMWWFDTTLAPAKRRIFLAWSEMTQLPTKSKGVSTTTKRKKVRSKL